MTSVNRRGSVAHLEEVIETASRPARSVARCVALVQARLGSRRFPRKILADLCGRPVLQHVYERACQIKGVDQVSVIVPWDDYAEIRRAVPGVHLLAFNGLDEVDVLGRYALAARQELAGVVVRVTGDCAALDPVVAGKVLELFHALQPCDYAWTDTASGEWPDGFDVEAFSRAALETAAAQATDPSDREHVGPWMRRHLRCVTLNNPEPWMGPKKLSIDTLEDLETVRAWVGAARGELDNGERERSSGEVARRHV